MSAHHTLTSELRTDTQGAIGGMGRKLTECVLELTWKGSKTVELGAFVVVPGGEDVTAIHEVQTHEATSIKTARPAYCSRTPIVGNDVLKSWMDRIRKLGVESLWLTSGRRDGTVTRSELAGFARQGVKRLLVIKLNSYAEMDLKDFFRFHCEKRNPITEARDSRGQLGVSLLDQLALRATAEESNNSTAQASRSAYDFSGYAKRILSANERQELVGDALTGACAMRPFGRQIRDQVWVGEGVEIADSARVVGPTYIGERTIIRSGATIGPFASVERDCVVDCGTTVQRSTVMPQTYLAPGVLIQDGVVDGGYLEHLGWGTVVDLRPAGLGNRIARRRARKQASCEVPVDGLAVAAKAPVWDLGSSAVAGQPWLQVQL